MVKLDTALILWNKCIIQAITIRSEGVWHNYQLRWIGNLDSFGTLG